MKKLMAVLKSTTNDNFKEFESVVGEFVLTTPTLLVLSIISHAANSENTSLSLELQKFNKELSILDFNKENFNKTYLALREEIFDTKASDIPLVAFIPEDQDCYGDVFQTSSIMKISMDANIITVNTLNSTYIYELID